MRWILVAIACLWAAGLAAQERRVALVVGNSAYDGAATLANPTNDATATAAALERLGFEVTLATDITGAETVKSIADFTRKLGGARLALFYFAGHGIQVGGQNFLLPTDVSADSEWALRYSAINVQEIVSEMEALAEVSIVILDACRNNPYAEQVGGATRSASASRGLAPMSLAGKGAIIAYAAAAGQVAADGAGEHSPYTAALLEEIEAPGVELGLMLRRVAGRVIDETGGDQRPELLVRLVDEVYFNPAPAVALPAPTPVATTGEAPAMADAGADASANAPAPTAVEVTTGGEAPRDDAVISLAEARSADRRFFGVRPVIEPPWHKGLAPRPALGWQPAEARTIEIAAPAPNFGAPAEVPLAATVRAWIREKGQRHWLAFEVPLAGILNVELPRSPEEIDLWGRVWSADKKVVADWRGAPAPGKAMIETFSIPGPGRYVLELSDGSSDAASEEVLEISLGYQPADDPLEPNPTIGTAAHIPRSGLLKPAIFPKGDRDWWSFWIDRPGLLTLETRGVHETVDAWFRIWDYNGKVVRDWAGPPRAGGVTWMEAELGAPGTYFIEMSDGSSDAAHPGTFDVAVDFRPVTDDMEPNPSFGEPSLQSPTGRHEIAIFPKGDHDWIAFDVDHPGELQLEATDVPEALDIWMRVWTAEKQVLRDWFGPPRAGGDTIDFADLPAPGRYVLEISDGSNDASSPESFTLDMVFTPQPDQYEPNNSYADAKPLRLGGEIPFNILPRGDKDWFRIDAPTAGELTTLIDFGPKNLDLYYRVWNSDRKVLLDWVAPYRKGGLTEGFADLPAAGTYFLEISDGSNDDRSIEHAVLKTIFTPTHDPAEPNDSFGAAAPVALGTPHRAWILPRGDRDWLRYEVDRAGTLDVEVADVADNLGISLRLWTSDAKASSWQNPTRKGAPTFASFPVEAPGTYVLELAPMEGGMRSAEGFTVRADLN